MSKSIMNQILILTPRSISSIHSFCFHAYSYPDDAFTYITEVGNSPALASSCYPSGLIIAAQCPSQHCSCCCHVCGVTLGLLRALWSLPSVYFYCLPSLPCPWWTSLLLPYWLSPQPAPLISIPLLTCISFSPARNLRPGSASSSRGSLLSIQSQHLQYGGTAPSADSSYIASW